MNKPIKEGKERKKKKREIRNEMKQEENHWKDSG